MDLVELNPVFIRHRKSETGEIYLQEVAKIDECQGIKFLCPKCLKANNGPVGTHKIICWSQSRGIPDDVGPKPGRWKLTGTSFHDITLSADRAGTTDSIWLTSGCRWHGFIEECHVVDA